MSDVVAKIETPQATPVVVHNEAAALISMIERAARDPAVDIDKFERLMSLKDRADKQIALKAFNEAVSAAKGEIGTIAKNRTVDFTSQKGRTNYKHEDFAAVASAVDPVLAKHGLSYRFRSAQGGGQRLTVTCILSHALGHSEETTLESGEDHSGNKNSTQAIGSAATYLQRYTLKLALGLASAHDDDAQRSTESAPANYATVDEIVKLMDETKADAQALLAHFSIEELGDLNGKQRNQCKAMLLAKLAKARAKP